MSVVDAMTIYEIARDRLQRSPFRAEIDWQASVNPIEFTESDLLRECAWVILCSGFRESVVRRAFPFISLCFCYWESSESICRKSDYCRSTALSAFGNKRKIQAILDVAAHIYNFGFCEFKNQILSE